MTTLPADLPSFRGRLVPRDASRVKALVAHLRECLRDAPEQAGRRVARSAVPDADPAIVAAACAQCGGHCCRKGGDDGFLDTDDLVRIRRALRLSARRLEAAYVAAVADMTYEGSCIFHGEHGCTLPREMRACRARLPALRRVTFHKETLCRSS